MKNAYLLDLSYHLYRCYYSLQDLEVTLDSGVVKPTGHITGVLNTLMSIRNYDKESEIYIVLDGYPIERKELMEKHNIPYKAGRGSLTYNIKQDTNLLCELACMMEDVHIVENEYLEADDVLFSLAKDLDDTLEYSDIFVYTSDNDLFQTMNNNISMILGWEKDSPITLTLNEYYESDKYNKKFHGVDPDKLAYYRALTGDASDNLKGIYRIPKVLASELAMSINDIEDYKDLSKYKAIVKPSQVKYLNQIEEEYERIELNYKLMKLYRREYNIFTLPTEYCNCYIEQLRLRRYQSFLEGENNAEGVSSN